MGSIQNISITPRRRREGFILVSVFTISGSDPETSANNHGEAGDGGSDYVIKTKKDPTTRISQFPVGEHALSTPGSLGFLPSWGLHKKINGGGPSTILGIMEHRHEKGLPPATQVRHNGSRKTSRARDRCGTYLDSTTLPATNDRTVVLPH